MHQRVWTRGKKLKYAAWLLGRERARHGIPRVMPPACRSSLYKGCTAQEEGKQDAHGAS